jgi:hypothetical protein
MPSPDDRRLADLLRRLRLHARRGTVALVKAEDAKFLVEKLETLLEKPEREPHEEVP